ncbi:Arc family DNA-binding protein [Pseudodonghicola flavimaris]|uniref:Arc family DNA-binding protein n=1 Tax=Pseudodonghicola flavimaris TaxID=3050036 RepID=A0ABT7F8L7_9RHOB|nr:Arc family DNA-binding protein [Pseudodonghicola flavimaris]MDK3020956.1 Arc family DNA-binding protein [Pseudodonghicola flavimaris]
MSEDQNRTLTDKFMLRLPDGMRGRIKAAAEANNRSMNAEIVATLEEKYPAPKLSGVEIVTLLISALAQADAEGRKELVDKLTETFSDFLPDEQASRFANAVSTLSAALTQTEKSQEHRFDEASAKMLADGVIRAMTSDRKVPPLDVNETSDQVASFISRMPPTPDE